MDTDYKYIIEKLSVDFNLLPYKSILEHYINQFKLEGIDIVIENRKMSGLDQRHKILTIAIDKNNSYRNMLWAIIHEYGHLLDGEPDYDLVYKKDKEYLYGRELKAWEFALIEIEKWPMLNTFRNEIETYKVECLNTY